MHRFIASTVTPALAACCMWLSVTTLAAEPRAKTFSRHVDAEGAISLPSDFRSRWSHLGSWVVQQDGAPGQGFHDVYTEPASAAAYRKSGQWPDGATLVKEIRSIESGALTTGPGLWAGANKVWFVMVKDTQGRFAGNPNWGNGWGWALFDASKNRSVNASTDHSKDCMGCHVPAKATDWVYVQGYPTLKP